MLVGASVLAAVLACVVIPMFGVFFQIPPELTVGIGSSPSPEKLAELNAAQRIADRKNSMLRIGLFGAIVGSLLGGAAGIARRRTSSIGLGAAAGLTLGGLFGFLGGLAANTLAQRLTSVIADEMQRMMVVHLTGWAVAGIGIGLAVGLAFRGHGVLVRAVVASLAAGLIGGLIFAPLAAILLPNADSDLPYPKGLDARALWIALPTILIGIAIARATKERRKPGPAGVSPS